MTNAKNKRSFKKTLILLLGLLLILTTVDHIFLKTKRLKTQKITITDKTIPPSFDGAKILVFSDVYDNVSQLEKVKTLVDKVKPDFIINLGNLMSEDFEDKDLIEMNLREMDAPFGKYTLLSNEDLELADDLKSLYYNAEFRVQYNSMPKVYRGENEAIRFVFLQSEEAYENALELNQETFNLGFAYDANQIDHKYPLHTLITSNNQTSMINIPFLKDYLYESDYLKKHEVVSGVHLRQTSGISSFDEDFRLFSTPDILVLTLRSSE